MNHSGSGKRQAKVLEENYWDCSVCTYRNTAEAFKCLMCDVRKGTSTRKPRINPQLVAQQVIDYLFIIGFEYKNLYFDNLLIFRLHNSNILNLC